MKNSYDLLNNPELASAAKALGALGGKTTLRLHGREHFVRAGNKGRAKRYSHKYPIDTVSIPYPQPMGSMRKDRSYLFE